MESAREQFTASDIKKASGITYRQLNDWDSKGALPSYRERRSGWRKFDPKQFFVVMVCAEIRKQFGIPIEKLAWLQKFMLQDGADHFSAAVRMMRHGLAVLLLTDLNQQFDMDADFAIGDLLSMGYCRYDEPQSYVLLLVNPLINKMLAALKKPVRLEISDTAYDAMGNAQAAIRVRDTAEEAVLEQMRRPDVSKILITDMTDEEVMLEIDVKVDRDVTAEIGQIPAVRDVKDHGALSSRKVVKRVPKEEIGIVAVQLID